MKRVFCGLLSCAAVARAQTAPPPAPPDSEQAAAPAEASEHRSAPDPNDHMPWKRKVHLLTGDRRVELRRASNALVCRAPCDAEVEFLPDEEFYLGGQGLESSAPFSLKLREEDLTLAVHAASSSSRTNGRVLLLAGGVAAVLGGAGTFLGYMICSSDTDHGSSCGASGLLIGSALLGVAGVALLIAGGKVTSTRTEFEVE